MEIAELNHVPDLTTLSRRFRLWHVESLLNQAADLLDRCIADLREYNSLNYQWTLLDSELLSQEAELALDKPRTDVFERDLRLAEVQRNYHPAFRGHINNAIAHADQLYNVGAGHGQGPPGHIKAGQNTAETKLRAVDLDLNVDLNNHALQWAEKDVEYLKEKFKLREDNIQRRRDLTKNWLALDIQSRMSLIEMRIKRDVKEILDRIAITKEGLKLIYGYQKDLQTANANNSEQRITFLSLWVRDAIQWMIAYSQMDQSFTHIFSLKALIGTNSFNQLQNAEDIHTVSFKLPNERFKLHENIRLRGIGASLIGKVGQVPWSVKLTAPRKAVFKRGATEVSVNQRMLPSCLLGRVENRDAVRPPEMCGLVSLMNASPMGAESEEGKWSIELLKPTNTEEKFSKVDDLLIEFDLVGQPHI